MDGRDKPGHDGGNGVGSAFSPNMNASRTTFSESVQHPTLKLVSGVAENPRPKGSVGMLKALLATALLLGVVISLALPAPAPRGGNLTVLRPGVAAR
jgi:hypothetical protein